MTGYHKGMRAFFLPFLIIALLSQAVLAPKAWAEQSSLGRTGKKAAVVGKCAFFGWSGGLVVGVASQAFKKNTKNVFMFGSLGMYVGIGLGLWLVMAPRGSTSYDGPDTYEDEEFGDLRLRTTAPRELELAQVKADPTRVDVPLYTLKF